MYKIAILGEERSVSVYQPLGFSLFSPEGEKETRKLIEKLSANYDYAIIFVTEQIYRNNQGYIDHLDGEFLPAIIILPGYGENSRLGEKRLNRLTENAIGLVLPDRKI